MPDRFCPCGVKMSPRMPRQRDRNGVLVCPMCAQNQPRTAAMDEHPDLAWKRSTFGAANTSLGRAGFMMRRTAASQAEQEARLADPSGWRHNQSSFQPVRHAIEGARAFANEKGLRDPHEHDFQQVMQTPDRIKALGRHYDSMPEFDKSALPHFHAMRDEVAQQHDFATKRMGIKFQTVDHDPYANVHEMVHDVHHNKTLKVMGTGVTGGHPFFSDEENDKFRGVHDLFGHAATGRDFSRHGEEAAYQAHSRMFTSHARPAMAAETRGQNGSLILNGHFGPQKIGVLPDHLHADHTIDWGPKRATRVAVRVAQTEMPALSGKQALLHAIAARRPSIVVIAHDSGDGETLFHCFAGETRYWTRDGIKTLAETVGTTQQVLSNTGNGGNWVDAEIREFGTQPLMKVTLRRNKRIKVVYATPEHRWWVRTRSDRAEHRTVVTRDLKADDRLSWLLPRTLTAMTQPSTFGIAHGVVYGDGTRVAGRGSVVQLWGEKDAQLLRHFGDTRYGPVKTENGVEGIKVLDLPGYFKNRPSLEESTSYLYGWLAGYFAADGTVSKQGQVVMSSASRDDLEFFQLAAMRLGIGSYDIVTKEREGFGELRELHSLQLIGSTLQPKFFLTKTHRERFETTMARGNSERIGWTVESVEETDRVETVYCAVVPEHENFVLDGLINTMNCPFCGSGQIVARNDGAVDCDFCKTAFTVQVQPTMPAFPQTMNGVPIDVPGMPKGGEGADVPPEEASAAGYPPDAGGSDPSDPMADPAAEEAEEESSPPPFAKASSRGMLRTAEGHTLPLGPYMAHLALSRTTDREATLSRARAYQRS